MKIHTLLFFAVAFHSALFAQNHAESGFVFGRGTYDIYLVKVDSNAVKRFSLAVNSTQELHDNFVANIKNNLGHPDFLAITASPADNQCQSPGLLFDRGKELSPLDLTTDKKDNFHMFGNAVLLITPTGASITESSKAPPYSNALVAIQSGPILINDGVINAAFGENSTNFNTRSGVGIYEKDGNTYLVFAISRGVVNFYTFAKLFKDRFNCRNAFIFDNAGCVLYAGGINRDNAYKSNPDPVCNYLIYNEQK